MSRPSSPVSACPLSRLQVQDGMRARLYHSTQIAGGLTLTLEGQRSAHTACDSLVLLLHCGLRKMLSIRLSDLLRDASGTAHAVSVDKACRRLVVRVPAQHHEIQATFEHDRDFSLSVCTLNKSGFTINDDAPRHEPTVLSSPPPDRLFPNQTGVSLGPRLSSITPLPGLDTAFGSGADNDLSFDSMLNYAIFPSNALRTALPDPLVREELRGPNAHFPGQHMTSDQAPLLLSHYNIFLNKQSTDSHRPRVSSPLRNSFSADESPVLRQTLGCVSLAGGNGNETPARHPTVLLRSTSSFGLLAQQDFRDPAPSAEASASRRHSIDSIRNGLPQVGPEQQVQRVQQSTQSFRDLMPRRRNLPFTQHEACAARENSKGKPDELQDGDSQKSPVSGTEDEPRRGPQAQRDGVTVHESTNPRALRDEAEIPASFVSSDTKDRGSLGHGDVDTIHQIRDFPTQSISLPLPHDPDPTVLVADPLVIRQLSNMTSKLLEQYQSDVSRGCDQGVCAQFYLERMQNSRREFWLSQLMEGTTAALLF